MEENTAGLRAVRSAGNAPDAAEAPVRRRSLQGPVCSCVTSCRRSQRPARRRCLKKPSKDSQRDPIVDAVYLVRESPEGCGASLLEAGTQPRGDAEPALTFGAFTKQQPGTRLFSLQGQEFFAFTFPHSITRRVGVWRQLGEVVAAGYGSVAPQSPCQLRLLSAIGETLAPGKKAKHVGPLADLYSRRDFDRKEWVYWESFWVPVGSDAWALKRGSMAAAFKPQIPSDLWSRWRDCPEEIVDPFGQLARVPKDRPRTPDLAQAPAMIDAHYKVSKAQAFTNIYQDAVWPGINSSSGPGSDPFHPMVRIGLSALDMVVDALNIRSILDAACGDSGWITAHFLARRPEIQYIGVDIVEHVIEENRRRHPSLRFLTMDLGNPSVRESLPPADLVFSKETLNHMYVQDAVHALMRLQTTGAKYLLTNVTRGSPNYVGAQKGGHQNYVQYDYSLPPFNLRKLRRIIDCNLDDWTEYALFALQPPP